MLLTGMLAFVVTLALSPLALRGLRRRSVLDLPSARSNHKRPTPRGGGVAPATGALLAAALSAPLIGSAGLGPVAAAGFGLVGLLDDVVGVRVSRRLLLQTTLAVATAPLLILPMAGSGVVWAGALLLGALWLMSYVNAFNFMDGIDGISVAQVVAAGVTWCIVGSLEDVDALSVGGAVVTGAALGFAPFNLPRARMFLGDVGSYFFGGWLAALVLIGLRSGVAPEAVVAPLALYLADTGVTLTRRVRRGEIWYRSHREHTYQRLVAAGWSHLQVTSLVAVAIAACSACGMVALSESLPERLAADSLVVAVVAGYLVSPSWLSSRRRAALSATS